MKKILPVLVFLVFMMSQICCCCSGKGTSESTETNEPATSSESDQPAEPLPQEPPAQATDTVTNISSRVQSGKLTNLQELEYNTWRELQDGDGVKVSEGGKARLEFPGPIVINVYNDSEIQDKTTAEVESGETAPRYFMLIMGGVSGYVSPGGKLDIAVSNRLSVTVLGTNFFIVIDEASGYITIGKFDGTLIVNIPGWESFYLDSEMVDIAPDGSRNFYPLPFSPDQFEEMSTSTASPVEGLNRLREQNLIPLPGALQAETPSEPVQPEPPQPVFTDWQLDRVLADHADGGANYGVSRAVFSPSGRSLITTGYDGKAILYDTSTWSYIVLPHTPGVPVWCAAFSHDGQFVATGSRDFIIRVWRVSDGNLYNSTTSQGDVWYVSFSPDDQRLAAATDDSVYVWLWSSTIDIVPPRVLNGHEGTVWVAAYSPDGQTILSASSDATALLWGAGWEIDFVPLTFFSGHSDWIPWAEFSRDGSLILTASADRSVRVWDTAGNLISVLSGHSDTVWNASFSPDGGSIATASGDGLVRIFDTASGNLLKEIPGHSGGVVTAIYSPDGRFVASASVDGTGRVYEISADHSVQLSGHSSRLYSIAFSPDSALAATAGADGKVMIWRRAL